MNKGMSNFLTLNLFVTPREHIQKNKMIDVTSEEDADGAYVRRMMGCFQIRASYLSLVVISLCITHDIA